MASKDTHKWKKKKKVEYSIEISAKWTESCRGIPRREKLVLEEM